MLLPVTGGRGGCLFVCLIYLFVYLFHYMSYNITKWKFSYQVLNNFMPLNVLNKPALEYKINVVHVWRR